MTRIRPCRSTAPAMAIAVACTAVLLLSFMPAAHAQLNGSLMSRTFTQGEWAVLPEYCIDTQAGPFGGPEGGGGMNRSPRAPQWVGLMGGDFWNMHHYCYALRDLRRVDDARATARDRTALLQRAEDDMGYVIKTSSPSMPLMPEVLLKLGEVKLKLGDLPGAQEAFERSRALQPDYWPAYTRWIDVLVGLKQTGTARALAEEGLRFSPDSAELQKRASALGVSVKSAAKSAAAK